MRFKVIGIVLLVVAAWFAIEGIILAERRQDDTVSATVFTLVAIFMAMVVRVLQAEKHHRDRLKAEEKPEEHAHVPHAEHVVREELSYRR